MVSPRTSHIECPEAAKAWGGHRPLSHHPTGALIFVSFGHHLKTNITFVTHSKRILSFFLFFFLKKHAVRVSQGCPYPDKFVQTLNFITTALLTVNMDLCWLKMRQLLFIIFIIFFFKSLTANSRTRNIYTHMRVYRS